MTWEEFEVLARAGRVPPEAEVRFAALTGERFVAARDLEVVRAFEREARETARIWSAGPPIATALLLGLQIRIWWLSQVPELEVVTRGTLANFSTLVFEEHQVWRLLTAGLLHVELLHIALNSLWFAFLGWNLERTLGVVNLLILFFAPVLVGEALSAWFSPYSYSIGSSGGVFGMLSAAVVIGFARRDILPEGARAWFGGWLMVLLLLVFMLLMFCGNLGSKEVDNWAHFGGLVTGPVLALLVDRDGSERRPGWNARVRAGIGAAAVALLVALAVGGSRLQPLWDSEVARAASEAKSRPAGGPPADLPPEPPRPLRYDVPAGWRPGADLTGSPGFVSPVNDGRSRAFTVATREEDQLRTSADALEAWKRRLLEHHPDAEVGEPRSATVAGREGLAAVASVPGDSAQDSGWTVEWRGTTRGAWILEGTWQADADDAGYLAPLGERVWSSVTWDDPPDLVDARARAAAAPRDPKARGELARQLARVGEGSEALSTCDALLTELPGDAEAWKACLDVLGVLRPPADQVDAWVVRAIGAPPEARAVPRVADLLATLGRTSEARGLLEIAWMAAPGDPSLKRSRRRVELPVALTGTDPWELVHDPATGRARPPAEVAAWRAIPLSLDGARAMGAKLDEDRARTVAVAARGVQEDDPGALNALLVLKLGSVPTPLGDSVQALAQELREAVSGTAATWIPPEVVAALHAHPDFPDRLHG